MAAFVCTVPAVRSGASAVTASSSVEKTAILSSRRETVTKNVFLSGTPVRRTFVAEAPRVLPFISAAAEVFDVEIAHKGKTYNLKVPADKTILDAGIEAGIDLPSSCLAGVCTTCSARRISGEIDDTDAVLSPEVQEQGFVLLCSTYPRSACKFETVKEDEVYDQQFGKYEYGK
eukprot:tig00000194_g14763.t1